MVTSSWRPRRHCALCRGDRLMKVLDLGTTPLANEYIADLGGNQEMFPLYLVLCGICGHLQMGAIVDGERLFGSYRYVTGTSEVTRRHLAGYAATLAARHLSSDKNFVVEIGSNDGTMLKAFQKLGATCLGVDPARDIAARATAEGVSTIPEFFTPALATDIVAKHGRPVDLVVANNVFAHAEDLRDMADGIKILIARHGVFALEVSYLRDLIDHFAFDTIYHEHFSYHAVGPLVTLFDKLGLRITGVEHNKTQIGRGSLRIYAAFDDGSGHAAVANAMDIAEDRDGLFDPMTYVSLGTRIKQFGLALRNALDRLLAEGKTVVGYGAAAKTTTLMYAARLDRRHCVFLVDDSPWKQGLHSPGLHIPIVTPDTLISERPDVCVVYAWNFADSIIKKFKGSGIRFIVPLPEWREVAT